MSSVKAEKLVLARGARVHEVAHAAVESGLSHLRANRRAGQTGRDAEAIHQLRVGVRRLRVAARLFKGAMGETEVGRLVPELRWIFTRLGAMRDYDVLLETLRTQPATGSDALAEALTRARDRACLRAVRALGSKRYRALVRALRERSIELDTYEGTSPRARKWFKKRLDKRLERVLARRAAISGDDEPALHELRKELKKLRYTADMTLGLWSAKRTKRYLRKLSSLQDVLGPINDAAVGRRLLERAVGALDEQARAAAEELERTLAERAQRELATLRPAFEELAEAKPYWR